MAEQEFAVIDKAIQLFQNCVDIKRCLALKCLVSKLGCDGENIAVFVGFQIEAATAGYKTLPFHGIAVSAERRNAASAMSAEAGRAV